MYAVSDAYLTKIQSHSVTTNWYGTLRTTIGVTYPIDPSIISEGSGKITRQICTNDDIQIGTTCSAELDIKLCLPNVDRYSLYNGTITLFFQLQLDENTWEDVPLGVFTISEPPERSQNVISIHAYDNMLKFNKEFGLTMQGNPYLMLSYACNACGVELGSTQEEIGNYPNGLVDTYTYPEIEVYTYRDFIGFLASYMCCFAYIGVDGKLYLKPYTMTPVREIGADWRFEYTPQDYEAYYTELTAYFAVAQETERITLSRNGLTYELGTNPLIQFNADDLRKSVLTSILNNLATISYTPFKAKVPCDPSLMVGDVLNFTDNHAVDGKVSAITKQVISINNSMEIECGGSDPNLNVLTEREKQIQQAAKGSNKDAVYYYDFANAGEIDIIDGTNEQIILFNYTTTKQTHVDFHAEVKCHVETTETYDEETNTYTEEDGGLFVTYFLGGDEVTEYYPVDTFFDGIHLLHLVYTWWASANIVSMFEVRLKCVGCSIHIDMGESRGYIAGVGLVGDAAGDGNVYVYEEFAPVDFKIIRKDFTEQISETFLTPTQTGPGDSLTKRNFFKTMLKGMSGSVTASNLHRFTVLWDDGDMIKDGTHSEDGVWVNDSVYVDGTLTTPAKEVSTILTITSHHSETFGDVTFLASFDEGTTWYSYSNGWVVWESGHGMAEPVMKAIPQSAWDSMLNGTIMIRAILEGDTQVRDIQIYTEVVTE